MSKTFVAINDPVHRLIRSLTRETPLRSTSHETGSPLLQYRIREAELPDTYFSLAMLHAVGGMSLKALPTAQWRVNDADRTAVLDQVNYFDILRLDKRCSRDLRFRLHKQGPGMLAEELLAYGTGVLRARNDVPEDPLHRYLWTQHGRIHTDQEVVYANIRALYTQACAPPTEVRKESFDSTNLIYGDAYGEIEQIWNRRHDQPFLELVVHNLHQFRRCKEVTAALHPPLHVEVALELHMQRQALWLTPPSGVRALLRRVEFILERTTIDNDARTVFSRSDSVPQSQPQPQPHTQSRCRPAWETDRSGYDGWLK